MKVTSNWNFKIREKSDLIQLKTCKKGSGEAQKGNKGKGVASKERGTALQPILKTLVVPIPTNILVGSVKLN